MPEAIFPNDLSWQLCTSNESLQHDVELSKPRGERKPLHTHDRSESLAISDVTCANYTVSLIRRLFR